MLGLTVATLLAASFAAPSAPIAHPSPRGMAPEPSTADTRALLTPARSGPVGAMAANVTDHTALTVEETYPILAPDGRQIGEQKWRIVTGTGNCCENYVQGAPNGRLFDFGGDYLYFTDDDGVQWKRVEPADPLPNFGEGAVAMAADGDVIGVAWNPYYGDRLVPFKYEAEEETWYYTTTKLHTPFFDRESLTVIPGPFKFAGTEYPYISVLKGGWPSKDPFYISFDGLNYIAPSARVAEQIATTSTSGWLDFEGTPAHDWLQTTYQTRLAALGPGVGIAATTGVGSASRFATLTADPATGDGVRWAAFRFPRGELPPGGHLLTDAQGRLHYVTDQEKEIVYMMSVDGGRNWITERIELPQGSQPNPDLDYRASGTLNSTVIAAHVHNEETGTSQDLVYKLSTKRDAIRLKKIYLVGAGDLVTGAGIASSAPRFDFATITFLPDGRFALSFIDQAHSTPTLAVQL
jgi:hypothetical protein